MSTLCVVFHQPLIEVSLQRLQTAVELFAKSNLIKLLQDRLVEPLTDAVSLRRLRLGSGVINIVDRQEQLVVMAVSSTAVIGVLVVYSLQ